MNETPTTQKLAEHAAEIRRLAKRSIGDVIEIGRHLTEARKILKGHNQWMAWLKDELGWPPQTAGRLIQVFELSLKHSNLESAHLPLSAYYILAAPYPATAADVVARLISVIDMLQAVATAAEIFHSPPTIVAPDEGTPG